MTELLIFITGIVVGAMNAIAGGGLLIGFPVLVALGVPPIVANATGHISVIPGAIASIYGYKKYLKKVSPRYLILLFSCFVGGFIGATLLRNTSSEKFSELAPILILFAVILFAYQPLIRNHLHYPIRTGKYHIPKILLLSLAILPVSIYGGYFGAGFGFIMLAFLSFSKFHEIHQMNALKSLAGLSIGFASLLALFDSGLIDWKIGIIMAAGNAIGGYFGAQYAQRLTTHTIRVVVTVIGISAAATLAYWAYN